MKHLFSYIVFGFMFFNAALAGAANRYPLPDDFEGEATRKILQEYTAAEDTEDKKIGLVNQYVISYEAAVYLYQKYTPDDIKKKSFINKLRPFFPNYTEDQLEEKRQFLYTGIGAYEYGKEKYANFVNKYLVPHARRKVRSEDEYDHPDEIAYVEVPEGEYVKVYNFKKFLTYSDNPDERAAIAEYEAQKNKDNILEQLNDAFRKIEWKKVAYYGIEYDNPLFSQKGISPVQKTKGGIIRLATDGAYIDNRREFQIGIFEVVRPEMFVLANNLSRQLSKPQINLSKSENIEPDYEILYPVPVHSQLYPSVYKYTGDFMSVINIKPVDTEKDVVIRAEVDITECDYHLECEPQHFSFEQTIEPHGSDLFGNGMENYFFRAQASMPQSAPKNLTLKEFSVYQDATGQSLFLELDTRKSVNTISVFIEENGANTTFKEPLISLRDNKIFVRVDPTEEYANRDLSNAEYTITVNQNNKEFLRQKLVPQHVRSPENPIADFGAGFFIWAFIGGLLLNFMPCVLPLWVHKLLSMFYLHKKSTEVIRTDIKQMLLGSGFTAVVMFVLLLVAKSQYMPFVWGIQLQNMPYVMMMLFGGIVLIKILPHISDNVFGDNIRFYNYALGGLVCVAAASCGAPYLSETFTSAANDRYIVLCLAYAAVACGFFLPYVFLLKTEQPQNVLNTVYRNKEFAHLIMRYMLYLAYAWYLLLIYWQTGIVFTGKTFLATIAVLFFADIFLKFLEYLNGVHDERITLQQLSAVRRGCYVLIVVLIFGCVLVAGGAATHRQIKHRLQNAVNTVSTVDLAEIEKEVGQGNSVLVMVETDWCLRCQFNDMLVFNRSNFKKWGQQYKLKFIRVNQANFDENVMNFMRRYIGNIRVPFYVLYTPIVRNGIVLSDRPTVESIDRLLIYNKRRAGE